MSDKQKKAHLDSYKKRYWKEVGSRIKEFMESKGWKQKDLARITGKKETHIKKYFNGELDPLSILEYLVNEGADRDYILTGNMKIKELEERLKTVMDYNKILMGQDSKDEKKKNDGGMDRVDLSTAGKTIPGKKRK